MTQAFTESGRVLPVTVLNILPSKISTLKTEERDGYEAVQVEAAKVKREFRMVQQNKKEDTKHEVGQEFSAKSFNPGQLVDITGFSKGRGMAGVIKRHGFHGFPASHGHPHQRVPGSIGQAFPQHVRKGVRMAGHMGNAKVTVKGALIVAVDVEHNLIFVKGSIPGSIGGLLKVQFTGQDKEAPKLFDYQVKTEVGEVKATENVESADSEKAQTQAEQLAKPEEQPAEPVLEKKEETAAKEQKKSVEEKSGEETRASEEETKNE